MIEYFAHATLPGLPERLWQAAFSLDMAARRPGDSVASDEQIFQAIGYSRSHKADEVIAWRKRKLGW
jgi:hypothetical protein